MSIYSADSLENIDHNLNIDNNESNKNNIVINLERKEETSVKLINNSTPFYLKHAATSLINDGEEGSNETVQNYSHDRKLNTLSGRNAIIAKGELAKASRQLEFSTSTTTTTTTTTTATTTRRKKIKEPELKKERDKIANRNEGKKKNENGRRLKKKEDDRILEKPMGFISKAVAPPSSTKCSFHVETIDDEETTTEMTMKAQRKLANVLSTSDVRIFKNPEKSYLEVYRRKLSLPRYKRVVRSQEGSSTSIYGDSQREELVVGGMEQEGGVRISFSDSSRDDQSELRFYRRLIERSATRLPRTIRSCETLHPLCVSADSPKSSDNFTRIQTPIKSTLSESRLTKNPTYKPYTIEDYRSLPVPKPDRSLGPDKEDILVKREWLMRRRSYGDSVSERNRQQILHTAQRFKLRRIAPRKCFLPSLNHPDTDLKIRTNSSIMEKTVNERKDNVEKKNHSNRSNKIVISKKRSIPNSSRKIKKQDKSMNHSINLNSLDHSNDSYLDSLQERHLREKELVDKLMKQAITS